MSFARRLDARAAPAVRLLHVRGAEQIQNLVERAVGIPFVEQVPRRRSRNLLFRQIAPRSAGSQNPQNRIHDHASLARSAAHLLGRRKHVPDQVPLFIRKLMP